MMRKTGHTWRTHFLGLSEILPDIIKYYQNFIIIVLFLFQELRPDGDTTDLLYFR